ncbi:nucleotide sugar dehydrogenase [Listeria rocourtiae]|uniref:nucleotide sugar dehydrogenase n=1 Tax=Listeria rocourtiae TaxID=647910 RepID=UPI001629C982|nr:nucleotide sugar dehydrogenase [Listeria rocourtiae]MBC1435036.1 nucleotide sugar dehydrogenase [Listeria rocourtiae]MBC1604525.1 nucleotide sugar dehydrogenase [Listeria rocourtiae]
MKIAVIGLGYIGLPTAIMFANHDQRVIGIDLKADAVNMLNAGKIHIEEPGLQTELTKALLSGNFKAQLDLEEADVFIIAVPTPNKADAYRTCDLKYVKNAVKKTLPYLKKGNVMIVESTIAPRTTEDVVKPILEENGFIVGEDIFLVHCPERVLPGRIIHELVHNNRIIGGLTPACIEAGKKVYGIFVQGELIEATAGAAELSKLMENTYRDLNIALANELAKIGDTLGINALEVIEMANKHPRVNLHQPGPGVGGHCLAVDPYFIVATTPQNTPLIQQARAINNSMPNFIAEKVKGLMEAINGKKITFLGVTYKGDVDDIRESPALEIIELLGKETTFEFAIFDPHVKASWVEPDLEKAVEGSDLICVLTDHSEFKMITAEKLAGMRQQHIFDTKNVIPKIETVAIYNMGNLHEMQKSSKKLVPIAE